MANKVILDAMIKRADFAQQSEASSIELGDKLVMEQISGRSPLTRLLRKPDFQRETNHWAPDQVAALVKSFATGELIPSLILWKSDSFVFVIDGAHRLSALRAWVENDYGDGSASYSFFNRNITPDQKKRAEVTRKIVESKIGRFSDFRSMGDEDLDSDTPQAKMASTIFTRSLHVQWIQGSQEVAETSFFKINSQGTVLDPVEEMLLRHRNTSYAIGARSIVRSGTGHKYWSNFEDSQQREIEKESKVINDLLFQPNINEPIKTLDLPLGGAASPVDALKMLVDMFTLIDGGTDPKKTIGQLKNDADGSETLSLLRRAKKVVNRVTGNGASSLGLHPAVYFYNENGKHSRFLFLGVFKVISDAVRCNNSKWFQDFTVNRKELEEILIQRKSVVNQGLANINSRQRIDRIANLLRELVKTLKDEGAVDDQMILTALGVKGNAGTLKIIDAPKGFSDTKKSAIFLQEAINTAMRCKICGGYLNPIKAVSYDHIERVRDGGDGTAENGQLTHPFCNTGIKS